LRFNISFKVYNFQKTIALLMIVFGIFPVTGAWAQGITVIKYPFYFITCDELVLVEWQESIEATLYFGTQSGQYNRHISTSAIKKLYFVPSTEGMTTGIYYCRISNGLIHSTEFPIYIESNQAANCRAPQNGAVITNLTPKFEWDAVLGVPFYHLILSDQPISLQKNEAGELQINNANIIYQVITSQTEIAYGTPDPSGYFNQLNGIIPPLLNSKTYNWIVLNNYGKNPALTSIIQSGVQSFQVNVAVNIAAPSLTSPSPGEQISSYDILFAWQAVENAKSYQFELFEIIYENGSTSTFPVWQAVTSATNLAVPARFLLKNEYYQWHVIALDYTGKGKVSEKRGFIYSVPTGHLTIRTMTQTGYSLPRVNIRVKPIQGTAENTDYISASNGSLNLKVQPGEYQIVASKYGFRDTLITCEVDVNDTTIIALPMNIVSRSVSGKVVETTGNRVSNAQIHAINLLDQRHKTMTTDYAGNFQFVLPAAKYFLYATKSGYQSIDTLLVDLIVQSQINLSSALKLEKFTSKIFGKVVDEAARPVFGALVQSEQNKTKNVVQTNMNGAFQLSLSNGECKLHAEKIGYVPSAFRIVNLEKNQIITLSPDLVLNSQVAMLSGMITDGSRGLDQVKFQAISLTTGSFSTLSNAKGSFSLSLPTGFYDLNFHRAGYVDPLPLYIRVQSNQFMSDLIIRMEPAVAWISGKITANGEPLFDAIISNGIAFDTSRINGFYSLHLASGVHQLFVTKAGFYQPQEKIISLTAGEIKSNQDIEMNPAGATIRGTVLSNGKPVAYSTLFAIQGSDTTLTRSSENGEFLFAIAPGVWDIYAHKQGFQKNGIQNLALQPNQSLQGIEIVLVACVGTVSGRISDSQGVGVKQAVIVCNERQVQSLSDNSGNYEVNLYPGNVSLTAIKAGLARQTKAISIIENQTQTVNFTLSKQAKVYGNIFDTTRQPINGAEVIAIHVSDSLSDFSDYTGEYFIFLPGGQYILQADKLGYAKVQQQLTIQSGQAIVQNFQLPTKPEEIASLYGVITVDNQKPLQGAIVKVSGKTSKSTETDMQGVYQFERLESGFQYKITPYHKAHFFLPEFRNYAPLVGNRVDENFVGSLYGDVSNNQDVNSFDGSLILRIKARKDVSPYFSQFPRDSLAADVSGNKQLSSFDASLIFRYTVGLISSFPVQQGFQYLPKELQAKEQAVAIFYRQKMENEHLSVTFFVAAKLEFYAVDLSLQYVTNYWEPVSVKLPAPLTSMVSVWNYQSNNLYIAAAGMQKVAISDSLFTIIFKLTHHQKENIPVSPIFLLRYFEADENPVPFVLKVNKNVPERFFVSQNYPNPFNENTLFKVWLPAIINDNANNRLQIDIFNILGQKVKTIIDRPMEPGYYSFQWRGDSEKNIYLASGIYLLQVNYGHFQENKKLIMVR